MPIDFSQKRPTRTTKEKQDSLAKIKSILFKKVKAETILENIESLIQEVGHDLFFENFYKYGKFNLTTWKELRELSGTDVELLSHAWFHFPQNHTLSHTEMVREIVDSKKEIKKIPALNQEDSHYHIAHLIQRRTL